MIKLKQSWKALAATGLCSIVAACGITPAYEQAYDPSEPKDVIIEKAANVIPTPAQLDHYDSEYLAFIHFGPNTFTSKEWGNGMEDPSIFNPSNLDTDQWCKVMKDAGMKKVIITVKHHDGFVLWQSRYTKHGVMSSPFKQGQGDVFGEMVDSCRAEGLKIGVYLSPADLYQIESPEGLYGNLSKYSERTIPRQVPGRPFKDKRTFTYNVDDYNEYYMNQLFELLTEYGEIHEVWMDGAHPKRKGGQKYVRQDWYEMIRQLAPNAVIFGGPDARWVGNEAGDTRDSEWSVIPAQSKMEHLDRRAQDMGERHKIFSGKYDVYKKEHVADKLDFVIAEVNTSIRQGWFYRDDTRQQVRSADDVFDIYERAVGGNGVFLLNIPPNREGKFGKRDVDVLLEVGKRIEETYGTDLLAGAQGPTVVLDGDDDTFWQTDGDDNSFEIVLPSKQLVNRFALEEAIATHSQRIEKHALDAWIDGKWQEVAADTVVGNKKILRFAPIETDKFRVRIEKGRLEPTVKAVSAHYYKPRPANVLIAKNRQGQVELKTAQHQFKWKHNSKAFDSAAKADKTKFYYTTDGSEPTQSSVLYSTPFAFSGGTVKAKAFMEEAGIITSGAVTTMQFGIENKSWKLHSVSSENKDCADSVDKACLVKYAFDGDPSTSWLSKATKRKFAPNFLALDLGNKQSLSAFTYLPRQDKRSNDGMIERGSIEVSNDGKNWKTVDTFEFGNLINDPVLRTHYFTNPVSTRFIRIVSARNAQDSKLAGAAEIGFLPTIN